MLKTISTAIGSALRAIGRALRSVAGVPFRALASLTGGGSGVMPLLPAAPEYSAPPSPPADPEADRRQAEKVALAMQTWCGESVVEGAHKPMPPVLPRSVQEWAQGLTRAECISILRAEKRDVSAHLQGIFQLPGVRRVARLEPAAWGPRPPALVADDHSFSPSLSLALR